MKTETEREKDGVKKVKREKEEEGRERLDFSKMGHVTVGVCVILVF